MGRNIWFFGDFNAGEDAGVRGWKVVVTVVDDELPSNSFRSLLCKLQT
jgi:hypothetical protein